MRWRHILLAVATLGVAVLVVPAVRRAFCAHRSPAKHPLGGFKCPDCGETGLSMDAFGYDGYVSPERRTFSRANGGEYTRSADYGRPA